MSQPPVERSDEQHEHRQIEIGGLVMVFEVEWADGEVAVLLSRRQAGAVRDALRWLAAHAGTDASTTEGTENA